MSSDDEELFDYEKESSTNSPKNDYAGDKEIPLRDEEPEQDDNDAQGPEPGEDEADAGYGGDENYGNDEQEKNRDEIGDQDAEPEEETMEIQYDKDSDGEGIDLYRDDNDEEYEDRREVKKKKREKDRGDRGDRGEKIKKKKHREKYEEAEEDEYAEGNDGKKKKRKGKEDEPDVMVVEDLCREMEHAYEEDIQCFRMKRPALNKLKLLPKVEAVLRKTANQRAFIDLGNTPDIQDTGLGILAKWLAKLPNGSLPSLQLRKKIVDIIYQLPITEEHLRSNREIGKTIYTMKSNPQEDPDLKKTLKDVIDKWTKLITDMANEYDQRVEDIRDRKKIEVSLDDFRQRNMSALKKSIPRMVNKRSGFDFVKKPVGVGKDNEMRGTSARQKTNEDTDKLIKDMKRKMRKDFK